MLRCDLVLSLLCDLLCSQFADARLAEARARIRELEAKEAELKQAQLAREKQLEAELAKLKLPEVPASDVKIVKEEALGQGSFKTAYLAQWKGLSVVKLKFQVRFCRCGVLCGSCLTPICMCRAPQHPLPCFTLGLSF